MKPTYYYPGKLSIQDSLVTPEATDDTSWLEKSRALQARRWKKIREIEQAKAQARVERQKRSWFRNHGLPRIQPAA